MKNSVPIHWPACFALAGAVAVFSPATALGQAGVAALPRNSAENRVHNRCELTGRPRGYYRKLKLSRIALRQLGNLGLIPGMVKSSW